MRRSALWRSARWRSALRPSFVLAAWLCFVGCDALAGPGAAGPPTSSLSVTLSDGRAVPGSGELPREARLRFTVQGDPSRYLYVVERSERSSRVIYPSTGRFLTGRQEPFTIPPQTTWPDGQDQLPVDWSPQADGELEYLLVEALLPRDAPPGGQLSSLDSLLAPPPYLAGPAADPAQVVARVRLRRAGPPPDEPGPDESGQGEDGQSGDRQEEDQPPAFR